MLSHRQRPRRQRDLHAALVPMDRGILIDRLLACRRGERDRRSSCSTTFREFYADEPFVRVVDHLPGTKDSTGTNFCDVTARVVRGRVITISCLDNLIKGAVGRRRAEFQFDVRLPGDDGAVSCTMPALLCETSLPFPPTMTFSSFPYLMAFASRACMRHQAQRVEAGVSLVVSDRPAAAAGVYTQNLVFAAPVAWIAGARPATRFARW